MRACLDALTSPRPKLTSPSNSSACSTCRSLTSHDVDAAPEGAGLKESIYNLDVIAKIFLEKMAASKVRLLWGTANLFSNRAAIWQARRRTRIRFDPWCAHQAFR